MYATPGIRLRQSWGPLPFLASSLFDFSIQEKQYGRSREGEKLNRKKKGEKLHYLLIDKRSVNYPE